MGNGHALSRTTPVFAMAGAVIAAVVVLVVMGTVPEKADAEAVAGGSSASVPELAWRPCPDPDQSGFRCATARVPLDYGDPQGQAIDA